MLNKAKKKVSKFIAGCLALFMVIGTALPGALVTTYAATINSYTVSLTDGSQVIALNDVAVTITDTTNAENTQIANTVDGVATFVDFVEEDVTYSVSVSEITGYETVADIEITPVAGGETNQDVVLTALETVVISGLVTDENDLPCEGVLVSLSGAMTQETATDENGEYSFSVYKGKDYTVTATHGDEKYVAQSTTVTNPDTDIDCPTLKFEIKTFLVDTTSDANGIITDDETVLYGANKTIEATANEGYRIGSFFVDGVEIAEAKGKKTYTYEFTNIIDAHTVDVTYIKQTYKITFTVGTDGKVSYDDGTSEEIAGGSIDVEKIFEESTDPTLPTTVVVTATPNTNYRVSKVVVDDVETSFDENDKVYTTTFTMTEDHTFVVEFALNKYEVSVEASENGSATIDDKDTVVVTYNDDVTITIVPTSEAYKLKEILVVTDANPTGNQVDINSDVNLTRNSDGSYAYIIEDVVENMQVVVEFEELDTLDGAWTEYISITPSVGTLKNSYTDENGNEVYVYSNDAELVMQAISTYTYTNYCVEGNSSYLGWVNNSENRTISSSCTITGLQVQENSNGAGAANVPLENKSIIIVIDKDAPTVLTDIATFDWTKETTVTITGSASDANTNPVSGLSHIVWSKDTELSTVEVLAESQNVADVDANGKYSFVSVEGEQDSVYYIYAVDVAGNVSIAATSTVKIDTTNPTVDNFVFSTQENTLAQDLIKFLSFGTICREKMYLTVSVSDASISSGLKEVTLYYGENETVLATEGVIGNTATFELTEEIFNDGAAISATVWDIATNLSAKTKPTDVGVSADIVKIDSAKPTATITPDNEVYKDSETGNLWYSGDVAFVVNAADLNAGITSVEITLNNTELTEDIENEAIDSDFSAIYTTAKQFKVNTSQKTADGENILEVVVTNNATVKSETYVQKVYIDTTQPDIKAFEITTVGNGALDKVLNFLTFGVFFNEKVEITVTAEDMNATAGVKSITLYADGEELETKNVVDNKCTFTVPLEDITDETVHFDKVLSAKATDNVNNTTAVAVEPTTVNSNIKDSGLMIETVKPTIEVTYTDAASDKNVNTDDGNDWYSTDVEFNVITKDADAGLRNVVISINDVELINENLYETQIFESETYTVNTSEVEMAEDGSYTLKVEVVDNAGNVSDTYTKTVYKDTDVPYIFGFDFEPLDYVEGAEDVATVEVTDYGFYFKEDTKVTIIAKDDTPSAGIKTITYYTVDKDAGESEEVVVAANSEGKVEFVLEANFKGQIYAKATDNVAYTTEEFVTPNSAIVEDEEKHKEETHIVFEKADAAYKTNAGTELYNTDVPVTITVIDTYSGIREIEWSVVAPYDVNNNQSGKVIVNNDKTFSGESGWELIASESNLVTEMKKTINVTNNSNSIVVKVKMIDRAGNVSEEQISFSIDKTNPSVQVVYDNNVPDSVYGDIYDDNRIATITITERNFNASNVVYAITNTDGNIPMISGWTEYANSENPDASYYVANIVYAADGDYTFDISFADLARNPANAVATSVFTIDKTVPTVSVAYNLGTNDAANGNYYNENRVATVTIIEHNFDSARVNVVGDVLESDAGATFPVTSSWTSVGDTHTATINYSANAKYAFDIEFMDKAGNMSADYGREEFYVDMDKPVIEFIGDITDTSANNGAVKPIIRCTDTNYDRSKVVIELTGVNNGEVKYEYQNANVENGETFTFADFAYEQSVDDIYILKATATDMAGNTDTQQITFSVNRYGSVYDLTGLANINGKFLQQPEDVVFTETNVNYLELDKVKVRLTKNGVPSDLREGDDYTIVKTSGSDEEWYVYTYTIKKEVFADDGRYSVAVYSVDKAENVNENIIESKQAEISFGIDNTSPIITILQFVESGEIYSEEKKEISVDIKDNMVLDSVEITLNGEVIEPVVENDTYSFTVYESNERQSIKIVARDLAGKAVELSADDFLISSNFFVRWYNNTPLFIGSIVGVVGLGTGLAAFMVFGKKKVKVK